MASSSRNKKDYPPRLFREGCIPKHKMRQNHHAHLANLSRVKEEIGDDVWDDIRNSSIGVVVRFSEIDFNFWGKMVHHFLFNQLVSDSSHEIWTLIDGRPIRFSLHEFAHITSLNCDLVSPIDKVDIDHTGFWVELGVKEMSVGPSLEELLKVLPKSKLWCFEKRRMVALLSILSVAIYGVSPATRIPLECAKLVLDMDRFDKYPWGRVSFTSLLEGIREISYHNSNTYCIRGFVHVLQIWAYEAVPVLGELYGCPREGEVIPLLSWKGSRPQVRWSVILPKEKATHGKLRVRHLIVKPSEEIYPVWEADEKKDKRVDNLIQDILQDGLDETFWTAVTVEEKARKKRKSVVQEEDSSDKEKAAMKKRKTEMNSSPSEEKVKGHCDVTDAGTLAGLIKLMEGLSEKVVVMDAKVVAMDANIEARFISMQTLFEKKIASLESDVRELQGQIRSAGSKEVSNSNVGVGDEVMSDDPSWIVLETKATSHDDLPIRQVVTSKGPKHAVTEKAVNQQEKKDAVKEKAVKHQEKKEAVKEKGVKQQEKKEVVHGKGLKQQEKKVPKKAAGGQVPKKAEVKQVVKKSVVKIEPGVAAKKADSESSDPVAAALGKKITAMAKFLQDMPDEDEVLSKRQPQLAKSLMDPFVASSSMKKIIMGVFASESIYDPLEDVEEYKVWNLMDYIDPHDPLYDPRDRTIEWYKTIITPREDWPHDTYGWLSTSHMASAFTMFSKRNSFDPSPFCSSRIAFLDPFVTSSWVHDYKRFKGKGWVWNETYEKLFSGEYPDSGATHKNWISDVDRLFVCLNINGNHWVGLDIKLVDCRIDVYDSIPTLSSEKTIADACQPFSRMIPGLLNHMIPCKNRKKRFSVFKVQRMKGIPQNDNPGDCGIYTLKYIECLALGCKFDGLCDAIIQKLRQKLAAELFDEVPEPSDIDVPADFGDDGEDVTEVVKDG